MSDKIAQNPERSITFFELSVGFAKSGRSPAVDCDYLENAYKLVQAWELPDSHLLAD